MKEFFKNMLPFMLNSKVLDVLATLSIICFVIGIAVRTCWMLLLIPIILVGVWSCIILIGMFLIFLPLDKD